MTRLILPAPLGYWFVQAGDAPGKPIQFYESPVIAWIIDDCGKDGLKCQKPLTYGEPPSWPWDTSWHLDSVLECPDGRCISDGDEVFSSRAAWMDSLRRDWERDGVYNEYGPHE